MMVVKPPVALRKQKDDHQEITQVNFIFILGHFRHKYWVYRPDPSPTNRKPEYILCQKPQKETAVEIVNNSGRFERTFL